MKNSFQTTPNPRPGQRRSAASSAAGRLRRQHHTIPKQGFGEVALPNFFLQIPYKVSLKLLNLANHYCLTNQTFLGIFKHKWSYFLTNEVKYQIKTINHMNHNIFQHF